jgi:IclR family transcriptional regulator, acetate operon repressor
MSNGGHSPRPRPAHDVWSTVRRDPVNSFAGQITRSPLITTPMHNNEDAASGAERQGIQVIARAAAVLRALERRPEGLSLGDLAKAVALPRSTVQRLVDALDNEGFVLAASSASGVRLGPALLSLAAATRFHIAEAARDTLEALAKECGETVDLSLIDQDKVVFIDQVSGTHRLTALSAVGVSFPLHSSANGKAVLAAMPEEDIAKLRRRIRLTRATPNTLTSWDQLDRELGSIRERGFAFDREENSMGISAVAVAIRGPSGELAAISIPAPTQRFEETEATLTAALVKHAGRLQQRLGR